MSFKESETRSVRGILCSERIVILNKYLSNGSHPTGGFELFSEVFADEVWGAVMVTLEKLTGYKIYTVSLMWDRLRFNIITG